jgi:tRNA G18 (ribose-2'-O)-methylase SpoU
VTDPVRIERADDERVSTYRDLKDSTRRRAGMFIAESELVIRRLLGSRFETVSMLLTPNRFERLRHEIPAHVDVFIAEQPVVDALVGFPLHRGALALARRTADRSVDEVIDDARLLVVMEDVVDPDNVGAVFRHAACFGADAVLLSPHAGDPLYRKAVRAGMGWPLQVPWTRIADDDWPVVLDRLQTSGWTVAALTPADDALVLDQLVRTNKVALVVGSEHAGLTHAAMQSSTARVKIAMAPGVDSLNVATTVAIALYELRR